MCESRSPPLNREFAFLTLKVLKDLRGVQPGAEAGQAPVSDLLPALVRDHLAVLLHDHQLGDGGDLVALLQLTEGERTEERTCGGLKLHLTHFHSVITI